MSWFRLKACPKCHGDLASDDGDWLCLQCGTYYYTGLYNYSRVNRVNRPVSGPVAGSQSNGQLSSPAEPGIPNVAHGPNVPDDCPQRQEKSLVWPLGTTPAMASAALGFTASSGDLTPTSLIPSYLISANDLSMRHQ